MLREDRAVQQPAIIFLLLAALFAATAARGQGYLVFTANDILRFSVSHIMIMQALLK